jgi:Uncharacterized oxidoreductase dhs-27
MALGQPEHGIDELRAALDGIRRLGHPPTLWQPWWTLGTALAQEGKDDEAAVAVSAAANTLHTFAATLARAEPLLGKLSISVTDEVLSAGELCARYLSAVSISMYTQSPRTLIHHDVQGDNLLVAGDGEPSLALADWQLTTAARPVLDLADFLVAHLDTSERRRHEDRLLEIYHSVLTERGIADYSLEQCRNDYGMALLIRASRLATAVGLHAGLTATPDGFWNVAFPRYARALTDLGASELLQQHYG